MPKKSRNSSTILGKRNIHGIPLVPIKVLGKTGWKDMVTWIEGIVKTVGPIDSL